MLSKYQISIVTFYVFICLYFFFFTSDPFSYFNNSKNDLMLFIPIAMYALGSLFIVNVFLQFGNIGINKKSFYQILFFVFFYGVFIVLPEEIIFRGFVQKNIQSVISNASLAINLSAIIFGAAHLLNGAQSLRPREWNWKLMTLSFVAGLFLGIAYTVTSSLIIPMMLHTLFGVIIFLFIKK